VTIYRVYTTYHESSESGTIEYGFYSTLEKAKQRAKEVWIAQYPDCQYEEKESGSLYCHNGWDSISIYVSSFELDTDMHKDNCGYT
jgi:hypothetical protein